MGKKISSLERFRVLFDELASAHAQEWSPEQGPFVPFVITNNHLIEYEIDPKQLAKEMAEEICEECKRGIKDQEGVCTVCDNTGIIPENILTVLEHLPGRYVRIVRPPQEGDEWKNTQ